METIKNSLNENQSITPEVKENLLELMKVFKEKFNDVDLSNLNERLKTLTINRESKFLVKHPCQYNPHTNEIMINLGMFEECDTAHWLTRCLVAMAAANENHIGFDNEEGQLTSLSEGYTSMMANYLVGDIEDNFYTDEIIVTNLIAKAIGEDVMYAAYFEGDTKKIKEAMMKNTDKELSEEELDKMLADFNNDLVSRTNGLPTNPFEKQGIIAETYQKVARDFPECFYFSKDYYPKGSIIDEENLPEVTRRFSEIVASYDEPKKEETIEATPTKTKK